MKRIGIVIVAVVVAFLAYRTWPLASAAQLGVAVARGDLPGISERIDFVALRRSLGRQVARAFRGPARFVVRPGEPNGEDVSLGLVFALQSLGWRLVELEMPPMIIQQLARELTMREKREQTK